MCWLVGSQRPMCARLSPCVWHGFPPHDASPLCPLPCSIPVPQALALHAQSEALHARVAQLEGELLEARQAAAAAEDRLAKASR